MIPIQEKMNKLNADWANVADESQYWDLQEQYDKLDESVKSFRSRISPQAERLSN